MITPIAYLEARDHERNIHRAYSIAYGQDLLGNWIVETTYGRIKGKGRTLLTIVDNEREALKHEKNPSNAGNPPRSERNSRVI